MINYAEWAIARNTEEKNRVESRYGAKIIASSIFGWDGETPLTSQTGTEHCYRSYLIEFPCGKRELVCPDFEDEQERNQ